MLGAIIFMLFFVLIAPASRDFLGGVLSDTGKWITAWAPFSYMIIAFLVAAAFASYHLMARWPQPEEPENPLARYKHDDVCE
jgi:hypothetical protein